MQSLFIFILLQHLLITKVTSLTGYENVYEDSLSPYIKKHGSRLSHRSIRECHKEEFNSVPHETYSAHKPVNISFPFVTVKRFVKTIRPPFVTRTVRGHVVILSDPIRTLSVLEPDQPGGCKLNIRQTVVETAKKNKCQIAINAGYFNTKKGDCLGNVISDGRLAHDSSGVQNAHFGLTADGQIFIGYLSHENVLSAKMKQLVGGVVWILRNGTGFVNNSKNLECEDTEETGPMDRFVNVLSARSSIGHDKDGNVILIQVDGQSDIDGINLFEMETLMQSFGVVNGINLDGGGSSTLVINGTTANYPYDKCDDKDYACDRKVSSIICVHSPYCDPTDCNNHGTCFMGECVCETNWLPPKCDQLFCGQSNCSSNGVCLEDGCVCQPGYFGRECNESCHNGWYGSMCLKQCDCMNAIGCDPVTGTCVCESGFTGNKCEEMCPVGTFGVNCHYKCQCENSCFCDYVTGSCSVMQNTSIYKVATCVAESIIQKSHLVQDNSEEKRKWYLTIIILGSITTICLASFLITLFCSCSCNCKNEQILCLRRPKKKYKPFPLRIPSGFPIDSSSDSETYPMNNIPKS